MTLKVIGTGFGRTGTDSMRLALNMLGFGPTHHMHEIIESPEQKRLWRTAVWDGDRDWEELFAGYNSCVDWPSAHYWRELIEVYPDAKVLLTWRSPESWWASMEKTLIPAMQNDSDPGSVGQGVRNAVFGNDLSKENALRLYEENVEAVKKIVPEERLLIHKLGDGWAPLCAHLGVAVPEEPYPHGNTTAEFQARIGGGRT
jgi:hypothetical protein